MTEFYGTDQAMIHDVAFGDLAHAAADLVVAELRAAGRTDGTVVDLGCGSGILAGALLDAGYDVVGVDLSADMVALARVRAPGADLRVGSIHDATIPPAVAVTAVGEVLNYATDPRAGLDAVAALARRVRAALPDGGLLLFDVSCPGRFGPSGRRVVFHDHAGWSLAMDGQEHEEVLERRIVVFRRVDDRCYRRTDEHHVLWLYDPDEVAAALVPAGFEVEQRSGYADTATRSTPTEGWAVFLARAVGAGTGR